jgi:CTP synthase
MSKQKEVKVKGASMRLGSYPCNLLNGSKAKKAYRKNKINERHRHRYEVNNKYLDILQEHGLIISGLNTELNLVEIVELKNHPWFVGVQFHPELKSRVLKPSPLFKSFLAAAVNYYEKK